MRIGVQKMVEIVCQQKDDKENGDGRQNSPHEAGAVKPVFGKLDGKNNKGDEDQEGLDHPLELVPQDLRLKFVADQLDNESQDGKQLAGEKPGISPNTPYLTMSPCINKYSQR